MKIGRVDEIMDGYNCNQYLIRCSFVGVYLNRSDFTLLSRDEAFVELL